RGGDVDGRDVRAQVEADRRVVEKLVEHCGEQMLSGVLLHVIETPRPIDTAGDGTGREARGDDMSNAAVLVDDVGDRQIPKQSETMWLAAGGRVESGPVEVNMEAPRDRPDFEYLGFEGSLVGIGVIEPFAQRSTTIDTVLLVVPSGHSRRTGVRGSAG